MGTGHFVQLHCLANSQSVRLVEICRALQTNPTWSAELVGKHWVTHRNLISIHIHSIVFAINREKSHLQNLNIPQARKSDVTVNPKNVMLFVWPRYVLYNADTIFSVPVLELTVNRSGEYSTTYHRQYISSTMFWWETHQLVPLDKKITITLFSLQRFTFPMRG